MNEQSIGVFDSGLGGLTVLEKLHLALPNEHFIYIGDNLHSPYGEKSKEQLYQYTSDIIEYFLKKNVKLVVLACNTTSCTVLPLLQQKYPNLPMIGVVKATVDMVKRSGAKKVLVMATSTTIQSGAYQAGIPGALGVACPCLVPLIEQDAPESQIAQAVHHVLDGVVSNYDNIVLGCTHYPIIAPLIQRIYPDKTLYSSSEAVVGEVVSYLTAHQMQCFNHPIKEQMVLTTGALAPFLKASQHFFDQTDFSFEELKLKVA